MPEKGVPPIEQILLVQSKVWMMTPPSLPPSLRRGGEKGCLLEKLLFAQAIANNYRRLVCLQKRFTSLPNPQPTQPTPEPTIVGFISQDLNVYDYRQGSHPVLCSSLGADARLVENSLLGIYVCLALNRDKNMNRTVQWGLRWNVYICAGGRYQGILLAKLGLLMPEVKEFKWLSSSPVNKYGGTTCLKVLYKSHLNEGERHQSTNFIYSA